MTLSEQPRNDSNSRSITASSSRPVGWSTFFSSDGSVARLRDVVRREG